jgi:hypothetical protein
LKKWLGVVNVLEGFGDLQAAIDAMPPSEAGCIAPQIAAITGHKSLKELQRYIEEAEQEKLAHDAMSILIREKEKRT